MKERFEKLNKLLKDGKVFISTDRDNLIKDEQRVYKWVDFSPPENEKPLSFINLKPQIQMNTIYEFVGNYCAAIVIAKSRKAAKQILLLKCPDFGNGEKFAFLKIGISNLKNEHVVMIINTISNDNKFTHLETL